MNVSQDAGAGVDLSKYTWPSPENMVVHAHADGDWGGVQFRVADAPPRGKFGHQSLNFSIGGFQQARGARHVKNRFT